MITYRIAALIKHHCAHFRAAFGSSQQLMMLLLSLKIHEIRVVLSLLSHTSSIKVLFHAIFLEVLLYLLLILIANT
jgi:hypothetical protein